MKGNKSNLFQPQGLSWRERARFGELASVMDPGDSKGRKNRYINYLHRLCISDVIKNSSGLSILDLGCGTGRFTSWLHGLGHTVCGADITEEMIRIAKQKDSQPDYVLYDGFHLPFKEQSFDIILSVWVLQHVSDKYYLKYITNQLVSSLKSGGRIILIEQVSERTSDYYIKYDCTDYIDAFDNCDCILHRPMIKGISYYLSLIKYGFVPSFFNPIVGRIHLSLSKYCAVPKTGYRDFLFVFEKRS